MRVIDTEVHSVTKVLDFFGTNHIVGQRVLVVGEWWYMLLAPASDSNSKSSDCCVFWHSRQPT